MYLDALLDTDDLVFRLPYSINALKIGVVKLAIPKTFDNEITFLRVCADIVKQQPDGYRTLGIYPTHNSDLSKSILVEPIYVQHRDIAVPTFSEIRFIITDQDNEVVKFEKSQALVVLHLGEMESKQNY